MTDHGRLHPSTLDVLSDVYETNPYTEDGSLALHIPPLVIDETAPCPQSTRVEQIATLQPAARYKGITKPPSMPTSAALDAGFRTGRAARPRGLQIARSVIQFITQMCTPPAMHIIRRFRT